MNHAPVSAVLVLSDARQEIMIALPVETELTVNFAIRVRVFGVLCEYALDKVAIRVYSGIH